ncbi:TPA: DEAD/DEAH box helicase [Bacillus cereus]
MNKNDKNLELEEVVEMYKKEFASKKFSPNLAKLYSHYTKVNLQQQGLKSWNENDFHNHMSEAIRFIYLGFKLKESEQEGWNQFFRKAGEILEWLSHPKINVSDYPLHLLSAASYQIAGYPALAYGLLGERLFTTNESEILRLFVKNDFINLMPKLKDYWDVNDFKSGNTDKGFYEEDFNDYIVREVISIIGIVISYMQGDNKERVQLAANKFYDLSKLLLHDKESFNWILSRLYAEITKGFISNSLRFVLEDLKDAGNKGLNDALESYIKKRFLENKTLLWPSQLKGLKKLKEEQSFVLCTPTGSGKTTIAELAIIKTIFSKSTIFTQPKSIFGSLNLKELVTPNEPIVLYLVPSRALATEAEWKISNVLKGISDENIKVTGLYGGNDWGPTDAWINQDEKTVLICTYEKGEALLRFLGPLFLHRLSLVIIDEAHSVQFDNNIESLVLGDNRSLRLEALSNRLINFLHGNNRAVIGLSAVIGNNSKSLSNWITDNQSEAEQTPYRSTRQLVGRLEFFHSGDFSIRYDLLNGAIIRFSEQEGENSPFIPNPFPSSPITMNKLPKEYVGKDKGFPKSSRPFLFWAAMQLAKEKQYEKQNTILISVMQYVDGYANDFLHVIEKVYDKENLPTFFREPTQGLDKKVWDKCLKSCKDYYGEESVEYKLLNKGIVVHYGKMPGLLSRLLIEVINKKIVHIVLASSTLSEGVNLPFDVVLIPVLTRGGKTISVSEFSNLIGRAGRPGNGTEGRSLIFLEGASGSLSLSSKYAKRAYVDIISGYLNDNKKDSFNEESNDSSPLAKLIAYISEQWRIMADSDSSEEFIDWLEKCVPSENENIFNKDPKLEAVKALDTLDAILISSIAEFENVRETNTSRAELEKLLKETWRKTYAYFATKQEEKLEEIYINRGTAVFENVYPNKADRRKIYKTGLQPRFALQLFKIQEDIVNQLKTGTNYKSWTVEEKMNYLVSCVREVTKLNKFEIKSKIGSGKSSANWEDILVWWLSHNQSTIKPNSKNISKWIKFVYDNFNYKFNWGLGTIISLQREKVEGSELQPITLDDWSDTELPWIVFWIKELITWGTYDPVVAYLLSSNIASTREEALILAKDYYNEADIKEDIYNAKLIRKWVRETFMQKGDKLTLNNEVPGIKVKILKKVNFTAPKRWRVFPVIQNNKICWLEYGGYLMAESNVDNTKLELLDRKNEFILDESSSRVIVQQLFRR